MLCCVKPLELETPSIKVKGKSHFYKDVNASLSKKFSCLNFGFDVTLIVSGAAVGAAERRRLT